MTVFTSAGTTLAISAAAPATYNEAGYEALTWTTIGEVGDLGDIPAKIYEMVTWRNIASRGTSKAKGPYDLGDQTVMVGIDPDDAGQTLLDTANDSDAKYSIKQSNPNLGDVYSRALVNAGARNYGDGTGIATRSVTLHHTIVSETEDGLVYVPPA